MNVFVVGATGELGRPAVREMVAAGHRVHAAARTDGKAAMLEGMGAEPVVLPDVFYRDAVSRAARGSDALLHLATRIPPVRKMRKPSAWSENHRLRSELTPMLVDIALQQDIGTFLAESITFIYPDRGADWIDESTPIEAGNPILGSVFDLEHEVERFSAAGRRGVTLRFALFYGPTAESTRAALRYARLRVAMSPGGTGYQSNVHTDDAGAAVAAALTAPAGTYNIGDDEPLPRPEFAEAFATAFDLGRLRQLPPAVVRLAGGPGTVSVLRSQRVRNSRFKETTGWAPRHPSAREGWKACAAAMQEEKAHA